MSVNVQLNKAAIDAFKARLKAAREGLKNDGVAMRQVAVFLDSWVQRNFKDKGKSVGGWEPYKYGGRLAVFKPYSRGGVYKNRRPTKANAQSIDGHRYINTAAVLLQDTSMLRHSFLPFVRKGVAGIGSDLPYSKPHDEGTDNVTQRRILPKDAEVRVQIHEILENFVLLKTRSLT